MTEYKDIRLEIDAGIAVLTINLPDSRNPISGANTIDEIERACHQVQYDDSVSAMIITGAGSAFSAGGNIKDMRKRAEGFGGIPVEVAESYRRGIQRIPLAVDAIDVPVIAAVNGAAIGAGCDLVMMCDIRIASTKAKLGETFLNLGIIPGDGGAWFLTRQIGYQAAAHLTFTARVIDAEEALRLGLVWQVVEPDDLMPEAMSLARTIADKPPQALRMAKRLLKMSQRMELKDFLDVCAGYQALAHHTEDHREALEAFFEKRTPRYQGR